jgi:tetratricopeptide (TPR) repeat protein
MADIPGAEKCVQDIQRETYRHARPTANVWETVHRPVVILVNLVLDYTGVAGSQNRWGGYEILIDYLRGREDYAKADAVVAELLGADPNNRYGLTARDYLDRKRGITRPPGAAIASVPAIPPDQPPVATTQPTDVPPAAPPTTTTTVSTQTASTNERVEYYDIAKAHADRKEWDKALYNCDLALTANPKDTRALSLKQSISSQRAGYTRWAVVKRPEIRAYDMKGMSVASFKSGSIVEISEIRKAADGELAVCRVVDPPFATSPVYMRVVDLNVVNGIYASVSEEEKTLRIRESTLMADIMRLTASLAESHDKDNPHAAEYQRARARYDAFWKKVNELSAKRDNSTGGERMRAIEELREMKGEDITVGKALEAAKKKCDEWTKSHPAQETSPAIESIKADLANVRQQLAALPRAP